MTQSKSTKPRPIIFWHGHHRSLLFVSNNYLERLHFIKENKVDFELKLRVRLFKPVKGQLPVEVIEAAKVFADNRQAWQGTSRRERGDKIAARFKDAEAWLDLVISNHAKEIELLHAAECKDCPWNGETIFTRWSDTKQCWVKRSEGHEHTI